MLKLKEYLALSLIIISCIIIFTLNHYYPMGLNIGVFFIIPLFITYYYLDEKFILIFVVLMSILAIITMFTSSRIIPFNYAVFNKLTGVGLFFVIAFFMREQKRAGSKFKNVTEQLLDKVKEMELKTKELEVAKSKAEVSATAKSQFLSSMSHEIRTPMNTIIGMTHLMMQENPKPDQVDNFKILKFSSEGLLALINDILDFSKIDAGKIDLEMVDFNLKELLIDIVNSQNLRASEKRLELLSSIDSEVPEMIIGDPTRLGQVLNNLIGNAVKFTENGSVHIDVVVEKVLNSNYSIKFTISDTGIGIPNDKLDMIFESFTQAGKYITRRFGGTGLGLSITKKLLELMGSKISVESEEGKGSKFYFTLEMKKSKITIQHIPKAAFQKQTYESLKGIKLLLVEDNEANQIIATKFLTKWEVDVEIANNGLEAVEKITNPNNYDLILMDLQMPYLDGYDATDRIRKMDSKMSKIPIIALTASALLDVHDRIILTGMDDYVTKPFIPNDLYNKVKKWGTKQ